MKKIFIIISMAFFIFFMPKELKSSPFSNQVKNEAIKNHSKPSMLSRLWQKSLVYQAKANRKITIYIKDISKNGMNSKYIFSLFLLSFIYGCVHALGPGHGKVITASYFLSEDKSKWWHGLSMAGVFALSHIFSAVLIVLASDKIIRMTLRRQTDELMIVKYISYSLILVIGIFMVFNSLRKLVSDKKSDNSCAHLNRNSLAFVTGLVPCTGASLVMLFSMAKGVTIYGALTCLFIALGIFFVVSIVGVITIFAKDKIFLLLPKNKIEKIKSLFGVLGGFLIAVIAMFLISSV